MNDIQQIINDINGAISGINFDSIKNPIAYIEANARKQAFQEVVEYLQRFVKEEKVESDE